MKPILAALLIALTLSTGTAPADDLRSGVSRANVQTVANHDVYAGESTFLLN